MSPPFYLSPPPSFLGKTIDASQSTKKAKATGPKEDPGVTIILEKQVSLTFSLKYLSNFAKSAPLADEVSLNMSNDVPLLVQFDFAQGTLQFFLAPKVSGHASFALTADETADLGRVDGRLDLDITTSEGTGTAHPPFPHMHLVSCLSPS